MMPGTSTSLRASSSLQRVNTGFSNRVASQRRLCASSPQPMTTSQATCTCMRHSVVLYFRAQYFLLHPIEADAQAHANTHVNQWLSGQIDHACPSFGPQEQVPGQGCFTPEM